MGRKECSGQLRLIRIARRRMKRLKFWFEASTFFPCLQKMSRDNKSEKFGVSAENSRENIKIMEQNTKRRENLAN